MDGPIPAFPPVTSITFPEELGMSSVVNSGFGGQKSAIIVRVSRSVMRFGAQGFLHEAFSEFGRLPMLRIRGDGGRDAGVKEACLVPKSN
jgi:hypothetical protein